MPEFVFTSPEGKTIRITGPEGSTPEQAFQMLAQSGKIGAQQPEQDPIRATVSNELEALKKSGAPVGDGAGRQFLQGATFGFGDELLAGATTPLEMIKRGTFNPREAYKYAKAREDLLLEGARKNGGVAGTVAEIAGGAATGGALARGGATLLRAGQGLLPRAGALAGEGAAFGAINAAGEAKDISAIPGDALKGAAVGGVIGGGLGAVAPIVNAVGRNAMGWASATMNPKGFAQKQVARALMESGRTPQQIAGEIADAGAMGQPFTVADAMGNAGQRMASNVARAPGAGRTQMVEFLDARQGDQGRRMAQILANGLDAPLTAKQAEAAGRAARQTAGNTNYGAARAGAGSVDVSPAVKIADDFLNPGAMSVMSPGDNLAQDSVRGAVARAKALLTNGRSTVFNFDRAHMAKIELDNMIEGAKPTVQRLLIPMRNELDNQLAAASKPYAAARNQYRADSQAIEAIGQGKTAAQRGRTEDTIPLFNAMRPQSQKGFRTGYADNLIETVQGGAMGQNKARPFTSQAMQTELPAFAAPGRGGPMMKSIGRENTMFETRAQALGGSKTADNLNDQAAAGVSPEIIGNLASGNLMGAARNLIGRTSGALSGYTPRVREELAKMLLQTRDPKLLQMLQDISSNDESRRKIAAALLSGVLSGSAPGATAIQRK